MAILFVKTFRLQVIETHFKQAQEQRGYIGRTLRIPSYWRALLKISKGLGPGMRWFSWSRQPSRTFILLFFPELFHAYHFLHVHFILLSVGLAFCRTTSVLTHMWPMAHLQKHKPVYFQFKLLLRWVVWPSISDFSKEPALTSWDHVLTHWSYQLWSLEEARS